MCVYRMFALLSQSCVFQLMYVAHVPMVPCIDVTQLPSLETVPSRKELFSSPQIDYIPSVVSCKDALCSSQGTEVRCPCASQDTEVRCPCSSQDTEVRCLGSVLETDPSSVCLGLWGLRCFDSTLLRKSRRLQDGPDGCRGMRDNSLVYMSDCCPCCNPVSALRRGSGCF